MTFLTARLFGLQKWVWLLILAGLLAAGLLFLRKAEEADDTANQQIGRTQERAETQAQTIENVKEANDAREQIRAPGPAGDCARYSLCLRSARNSAQCSRFLPPVETGHGCSGPISGSE